MSPSKPSELLAVRHSWSQSDRFVPRAFVRPIQRFMEVEAAGAIVMLIAAVAALAWANSPWHEAQATLWSTHLDISLGDLVHLELTLVEWINDALMAVFFFLVGLEIKRELVHGELRDPRQAALPAIAALGGMVAPALIYLAFNAGGPGSDGWGIPMATDIAFAVAIVALVGNRVPAAAKVFLLTLAIADDIGAIVVIAIFYTEDLSFGWLGVALATFAVIEACKRLLVRSLPVYLALGAFAWLAVHESGVHATLAGVIVGLLTPAWSFYDPRGFAPIARRLVDTAETAASDGVITEEEYELNQASLEDLNRLTTETMAPLERIEHKLQNWVAFVIVPLFAFSNAGVRLTSEAMDGITSDDVVRGVVLGLVVGKIVGVFAFTFVGDKLGIGRLPRGVTYRHVLGLSATAGVGFTVALFVAGLAFGGGHGAEAAAGAASLGDSAKIGILTGSLIAGIAGYLILRSNEPTDDDTFGGPDRAEPALVSPAAEP